jgi:hypothetical protein
VDCPCCGWKGYAFPTLDCGTFLVYGVECPRCQGQERHRLLHVYRTSRRLEIFETRGWILHFAPEKQMSAILDRNPRARRVLTDSALSALANFRGDRVQSDIHHLPFADDPMDAVFCPRVLEYVRDDQAASWESLGSFLR